MSHAIGNDVSNKLSNGMSNDIGIYVPYNRIKLCAK